MNSLHSAYAAPESVTFDDTTMYVVLSNGETISTPLVRFPRLLKGTPEQRKQWRVIGAGNGIHWPLLDEDISVNGLFTERKKEAEIVSSNIEKIISTIGDIYAKSSELRRISGGRRFIPDGIFVATTGQVVAEYIYGLNPGDKESTLRTWDGKSVKVALTGHTGTGFGIRWTEATKKSHATFLLCLQLDDNGFREIYNGPFPVELLRDRKVPANGQVHLSIAALSDLNPAALDKQHSLASINRLLNAKLAHAA